MILPGVEVIVDKSAKTLRTEMHQMEDRLTTGNDKIIKKLDIIITEQAAHFAGHEKLETNIKHLRKIFNYFFH